MTGAIESRESDRPIDTGQRHRDIETQRQRDKERTKINKQSAGRYAWIRAKLRLQEERSKNSGMKKARKIKRK